MHFPDMLRTGRHEQVFSLFSQGMSYTAFLVQDPNVVKPKREGELGVGVDVGGCSLRTQEISPAEDQDHSIEIVSSRSYSLTKLEKDMVRDGKARICCGLFLPFSLGRNGLVSGWELEGLGMELSSGSPRCWMSRQSLELSRAGTALGLLAAATAAAAPALALPSPWRRRRHHALALQCALVPRTQAGACD